MNKSERGIMRIFLGTLDKYLNTSSWNRYMRQDEQEALEHLLGWRDALATRLKYPRFEMNMTHPEKRREYGSSARP